MSNRIRNLVIGATATLGMMVSTLGVAADPAPAVKPVPTSNKWRVELDGRADSDGEIILAIVEDGVTTNVTTKVAKGKSENEVARLIRDQVKIQSPAKMFHAETDDGEDVLIKKNIGKGVDNFGLQLVSTSVTGLEIDIKKE